MKKLFTAGHAENAGRGNGAFLAASALSAVKDPDAIAGKGRA
jgi:hypothetical protein